MSNEDKIEHYFSSLIGRTASMDPLILIVEELHRARGDVERYETDLTDCESRPDFNPQGPRYNRLLLEKELVLKNLCDLRLELSKKGKLFRAFFPRRTSFFYNVRLVFLY